MTAPHSAGSAEFGGIPAKVWAVLLVVYVVWGSIYLGINVAIKDLPALGSMAARFLVAGLLMAGWAAARHGWRVLAMSRTQVQHVVLLGILLLGLGNGGNALGQLLGVPSGTTALIIATVPTFVMLLELIEGKRPGLLAVAGLVLGFLGLAILVSGKGSGAGSLSLVGVASIVIAAFTWALGSWMQPRLTMPTNHTAAAAHQMLAAGAFLVILAIASGESWPTSVGSPSLIALGYLVVAGSIIGFTSYSWLLGRAPLGLIATHTFVNPVVAVALGALILDEAVTGSLVVGGGLIVASVVVAVVAQVRRRPAAPAV